MTARILAALPCVVVMIASTAAAQAGAGDAYAAADSADLADDVLVGVDAGDYDDVADALGDAGTAPRASAGRRLFARTDLVRGERVSERVTVGGYGVATGWFRRDHESAHWVEYRGDAWLEHVTAGGLRVRCGEGLVLGATRSRFASMRSGDGAGLSVGPSLSLSRPARGGGIAVRFGGVRLSAAAWEREAGGRGRWLSVSRSRGPNVVAASGGMIAPDAGDPLLASWSLAGSHHASGYRVSGEVASVGAATLARVRVQTGERWTADVFVAGADASGGVAVVDDDTRERGAALYRHGMLAGWTTTVAYFTVDRRSPGGHRHRRRVQGRGTIESAAGVRWNVSARYDDDVEVDGESGRLAEREIATTTRRGRARVRLEVPAGPVVRVRYHVQAMLEQNARPGYLSGIEVLASARRGELRVSVSNVAIPGDGSGILARPGIAGFETVSASGRRGSDVAARATVALGSGTHVAIYAGVPSGREARVLASLRWRY